MTGATLTARATTEAVRRVLAIHAVVAEEKMHVTRAQVIFLHFANLVVAGTGLVYAWMRYPGKTGRRVGGRQPPLAAPLCSTFTSLLRRCWSLQLV